MTTAVFCTCSRIKIDSFAPKTKLTNSINPLLRYFKETEISTPTLYIMGREDYMFLPPVEQIVAQHKYSTLEVIENCGHVCNVEKPRDFNKISINFIENNSI